MNSLKNLLKIVLILSGTCILPVISEAYFEDYPPYKFKDGPPKHAEADMLIGCDKYDYKSQDGKISIHLKDTADTLSFIIKDDKTTVVSINERSEANPHTVWSVDLDNNGLKDFVVFNWYGGCGLAFNAFRVDIFLKKQDGAYSKVSYDTDGPGLEDFVDLNNDGQNEVIIGSICSECGHTYFTYNIYEFKDYKLINADTKFKGFPKFVWHTYKPNDKNSKQLSKDQRDKITNEKNSMIRQ